LLSYIKINIYTHLCRVAKGVWEPELGAVAAICLSEETLPIEELSDKGFSGGNVAVLLGIEEDE